MTIDAPQIEDALDLKANLAAVQARLKAAARDKGRTADDVSLIAVSKMHPAAAITPAIAAGHLVFGENRVQEAKAKWPSLKAATPDIELHLIGPLQTNKVRDAVALFDVIQTVDRPKLARALAAEMAKTGRRPGIFIEINTGEEPQKAGVMPEAAEALIALCRDELDLAPAGLMCIPPQGEEPSLHFALLRDIARRSGLAGLSMGMSDDFETAVRFGATHVRVGTAIFGPRPV
ncbi:MAG: YggS family pyridoxal phosphate-dependent enzyme [Alphaproteobacteria bacterium]